MLFFASFKILAELTSVSQVEYTPQAYVPSDLDLFFHNFSSSQVGERPVITNIDGGTYPSIRYIVIALRIHGPAVAIIQTNQTGFNFNGESNLDLQFSMALVGKSQPVTLYQVGDDVEGKH